MYALQNNHICYHVPQHVPLISLAVALYPTIQPCVSPHITSCTTSYPSLNLLDTLATSYRYLDHILYYPKLTTIAQGFTAIQRRIDIYINELPSCLGVPSPPVSKNYTPAWTLSSTHCHSKLSTWILLAKSHLQCMLQALPWPEKHNSQPPLCDTSIGLHLQAQGSCPKVQGLVHPTSINPGQES